MTDIGSLLEAVFQRYGYDFRNYARSSIERRIHYFGLESGFQSTSALRDAVLGDENVFQALVTTISVPVTDMFRDPFVYRVLRKEVLPYLATFPYPRVWQAGCASGEEVYSLSILLEEEGLTGRTLRYATDLSQRALQDAQKGIYPAKNLDRFEANYRAAGGRSSFSSYCTRSKRTLCMHERLRHRVLFSVHNLVSDGSFGEVHFIMCRNVLIYFDRNLQNRVLALFAECLRPNGYLCLGTRETTTTTKLKSAFECIDRDSRLYIRK